MKKKEYLLVVSAFSLLLLFVFIAPVNAGVSPDEGRAIGDDETAIIGETNLRFVDNDGNLIPSGTLESTWWESNINIRFRTPFDTTVSIVKDKLIEGKYKVVGDNGKNINVYFNLPDLHAKTKVCGEDFSWVTRGDNITFEADTYLEVITGSLPNNITYKLLDPQGVQIYTVNNVSLKDINVSYDGSNSTTINTTGLDIGTYTLCIKTDPATNNGLDEEGTPVTFDVKSDGVSIEAEPKEQFITKDIVFTISTTPHTNISLNVTWGMESVVCFKEDVGDIKEGKGGHNATGVSDEHGYFKAAAYFNDTGAYEITATEYGCNVDGRAVNRVATDDNVWVKIKQFTALVSTDKSTYYIGEDVKVTGSATAGNSVTIKIDGNVVAIDKPIEGFDYTWKTAGMTPGSYEIAIWVLPASDPETDLPDASVTIILLRGGLNAEVDREFVAHGDYFTIEGTVPGRDRVDILTIGPKGGSGHGFDSVDIVAETDGELDAPGLTHFICGVSVDGAFKTDTDRDELDVGKDVNTGMYKIIVLNYGIDGVWGTKTGTSNLLKAITSNYKINFATKTTDEILALIVDKTVGQPGSDDLLCIATIKVENGFVRIDDIEDVPLGSKLKVTGSSNREVGTTIVVTVEGPTSLKPKITSVETNDTIFYNTIKEVSFDTKTAKIGEYIVTAKDNDEHMDTTTLNIVMSEEPLINFSLPIEPAVEPANQSDNESANVTLLAEALKKPVFKVTFTALGLLLTLVVTWFVVSTRKKPTGLPRSRNKRTVSPNKRKKLQSLPRPGKRRF